MIKYITLLFLALPFFGIAQKKELTKEEYIARVKAAPDSISTLVDLRRVGGYDPVYPELQALYNNLSNNVKNSTEGKEFQDYLNTLETVQIGKIAPAFTQNDTSGNPVQLADFKGKYVLLDFWASWCAPCRRENPNLVKSYAKYQKDGFEILGVSMDKASDKAKWLKAIQDDGLTWKQVGDLKGWDNEAGVMYDVKAIPMNFLVDPNGKIIAKYLRGEELDKKLAEIFKK